MTIIFCASCTANELSPISDKECKTIYPPSRSDLVDNRFGVDGISPEFLEKIHRLGVRNSGLNAVSWQILEPSLPENKQRDFHKGTWNRLEQGFRKLRSLEHGLQINLLAHSNWAVELSSEPYSHPGTGQRVMRIKQIKPEYLELYRDLVVRLLRSGRDVLVAVQIGSEAENAWQNAEGYVEKLCKAYTAVKTIAPEVAVWSGGFNVGPFFALTPQQQAAFLKGPHGSHMQHKLDFLDDFFALAENCFDVLTIHLNDAPHTIPATVEWFQSKMVSNGYTKPVWADDMASGPLLAGPRGRPGVNPEWLEKMEAGDESAIIQFRKTQASFLVKKIVTAFAAGVEGLYISTDSDWTDYHMRSWRWMGLLNPEGNPHPAYYSYQQVIENLAGFSEVKKISPGRYGFSWNENPPAVVVAWSDHPEKVDFSKYFPCGKVKVTRVIDEPGQTEAKWEIVKPDSVFLEPRPVFIEAEPL